MSYGSKANGLLDDYANIRTLPAALSALYLVASLYQFGGISQVQVTWLSYTLTPEHAVWASISTYAIAFAGSQTKRFENYEQWEQGLIALGPVLIIGEQYVAAVGNLLLDLGDPLGMQLAFVATLVSWGVAVR